MTTAPLRGYPITAIVLLVLICLAQPAVALVIDGSFDTASSVYDRRKNIPLPPAPAVTCGSLPVSEDSYNDQVRYRAYRIMVDTATVLQANLVTSSTPSLDLLMGLYCGELNPADPGTHLMALDDDGSGYPNPSLSNWGITLQPGQVYTLVIMNYSSEYNTDGSYNLTLVEGVRLLPSLEYAIVLLQILTGQSPPASAVAPLEAIISETQWNLGHAIQFLQELTP